MSGSVDRSRWWKGLLGTLLIALLVGGGFAMGHRSVFELRAQVDRLNGSQLIENVEPSPADRGEQATRIETNPAGGRILLVRNCPIMVLNQVRLGVQRSGIVKAIDVREGDSVDVGQILLQIDDDLAQASLARHEREAGDDVELRYAKKVSEVARTEYVRALELNREIPNAHSELQINGLRMEAERAILQIEQAENRIELARLRLAEAQSDLRSYQIKSPLDGFLQRVNKQVGEAVHEGESVIDIASFDRLKVAADLPLQQALLLRRGMRVAVSTNAPRLSTNRMTDRALGRIVFVGETVHEVSGTVQVWAEIDNIDRGLFAGMTAVMRIELD